MMGDIEGLREELKGALLDNNETKARATIFNAMEDMPPIRRVEEVISPVLEEIGQNWQEGEIALSQVYFSSEICEGLVLELLDKEEVGLAPTPKIAIATLEDYHRLGSKVVRMSLQAAGQNVIDYGRMDAEELAEKACEDGIEYLLVSTLMLRSAMEVKKLRERLSLNKSKAKIIVGGAPFRFNWSLWKNVGADFTAASPMMALEFIRREEESRER